MSWPKSIPTTVIVSEHPPFTTTAESAAWTQDHKRFVEDASNRSFIVAENSGHLVMTDRVDMVTNAVVAAVKQVERSQSH